MTSRKPRPATPNYPVRPVSCAGLPWTPEDDHDLLFYGGILEQTLGKVIGYPFVAEHDLHRLPGEGLARVEVLRGENPELCAKIVAEINAPLNWLPFDPPPSVPRPSVSNGSSGT